MFLESTFTLPPNKQLQRPVIDKVPSHMRRRAAAELQRYASTISASPGMSHRVRRICIASLVAVALLLGANNLLAQDTVVSIYVNHLEANGMRFESVEELRQYLLSADNDFFGVFVGECGAQSRQPEVMRVVTEVLGRRLAARGQSGIPVNMEVASVPCPGSPR